MIGRPYVSDKVFVDSNILVYAHDVDEPRKREIAIQVFDNLWTSRTGALSMQVLQEFYSIATRKIASPLPKPIAREAVERLSPWCIETTPKEIAFAFRIEDTAKISFWDALIVAAALKSGAKEILSEDLNAGQSIAGIHIVNPFASGT
jgi:predicted nucleic acid-binding protein